MILNNFGLLMELVFLHLNVPDKDISEILWLEKKLFDNDGSLWTFHFLGLFQDEFDNLEADMQVLKFGRAFQGLILFFVEDSVFQDDLIEKFKCIFESFLVTDEVIDN